MKNIIALILSFMLLIGCVPVCAAASEEPADFSEYDCVLEGELAGCTVVYKAPESFLDSWYCNQFEKAGSTVCFYCNCDTIPFYLIKDNKVYTLKEAYGEILDHDTVSKILRLIHNNEDKLNGFHMESIDVAWDATPDEGIVPETTPVENESGQGEESSKYECILGNINGYIVAYKTPQTITNELNSIQIGFYTYSFYCSEFPIVLVDNNDKEYSVEEAYGTLIDDFNLYAISHKISQSPRLNISVKYNFEFSTSSTNETVAPDSQDDMPQEPWEYSETIPRTPRPTSEDSKPLATDPKEPKVYNSGSSSSTKKSSSKPKLNIKTATLKCGKKFTLSVKNRKGKKVSFSSSFKSVAKVSKKGVVTSLKRGRAVINVKVGKSKLKCVVKVTSNPRLSKSSITVKKGKRVTVNIIGKAKGVNNKYKNSKRAKIASKKSASKIKIKGKKRGKSTLKITVNGVALNLKVKVK